MENNASAHVNKVFDRSLRLDQARCLQAPGGAFKLRVYISWAASSSA